MKRKIAYISLTVAVGLVAFFSGRKSVEPETVIKTVTETVEVEVPTEIDSDYFDMSQVVDFVATEDGLQLYIADGSGYYWERTEKYE